MRCLPKSDLSVESLLSLEANWEESKMGNVPENGRVVGARSGACYSSCEAFHKFWRLCFLIPVAPTKLDKQLR